MEYSPHPRTVATIKIDYRSYLLAPLTKALLSSVDGQVTQSSYMIMLRYQARLVVSNHDNNI